MQITPDYLGGAHGIQSILNSYYEQQIASIGTIEEQLTARKLIEEGLIIDGARVSLAEAIVKNNYAIDESLLEELLHTRLIRVENTHLGRAYEVSHDTLVRPILKSYESRRLAEERLEQKRLLEKEQRKRRRSRIIAILGTVLCIVALIVLYIVWRQAKALKDQKQHLELSNAVAEASVFFSENNYVNAFYSAYQAYKQYQEVIIDSKEQLKIDIIENNSLKKLKEKEPYIYRNIWSNFYVNYQLYMLDDQVYSMPMPLVLDKAWLSLTKGGGATFVGQAEGGLDLLTVKDKKVEHLAMKDPMFWLMENSKKNQLVSEDENILIFWDTTGALVRLDRAQATTTKINLQLDWEGLDEGSLSCALQKNGEKVVVFDDLFEGLAVYNSKGELLHDFPTYEFLAIQNDKLYYQEANLNQLGVLDLTNQAQYFIQLPSRVEKLIVLQDYLAVQRVENQISCVKIKRSKDGLVTDFSLLKDLETNATILDGFGKNMLVAQQFNKKDLSSVFLWDLESNHKKKLGESYVDLLRIDSLLVYLDHGMLRIYPPEGAEVQLVLPHEFEYTQMYSLNNRFVCFPNVYQNKTLVIDFKMSPVQEDGPWEDQAIYTSPSNDGSQLLVIAKTGIYIQSLADQSILFKTSAKEGWDTRSIQKVDFSVKQGKVLVQTENYVWSWSYKDGKEVFYEGKCYMNNGYLCQQLSDGHYRFIDLSNNEEIWNFNEQEVTACWFAPANNKKKEQKQWAILAKWNAEKNVTSTLWIDLKRKQRIPIDIVIDLYGVGEGGVDFTKNGEFAAVYDYYTQAVLLIDHKANYLGEIKVGEEAKVKWINDQDLLVANARDVKILTQRKKEFEISLDRISDLGRRKTNTKGLKVISEKNNKAIVDWYELSPQLYKSYVFINRNYEPWGDEVIATGFMYAPNQNRRILEFPRFVDEHVYPTALMLSEQHQKAWTVTGFYAQISTNNAGHKSLQGFDKGYLLAFDLDPDRLFDKLKASKNLIEQLLQANVMTIN